MQIRQTLGLDLGTNSVAAEVWDTYTKKLIYSNTLVFPDGMNNEESETPASARRQHRQMRRMRYHKRIRKMLLLKVLTENGMSPFNEEELAIWRTKKSLPAISPKFQEWMAVTSEKNPYEIRNRAANERISPLELGRVLYLIANRRGYKSLRKSGSDKDGDVKKSISGITEGMEKLTEELHLDHPCTIGEYFYHSLKQSDGKEAIRRQVTGREEHYIPEFRQIMKAQGIAEDSVLYRQLLDVMFSQRPLRSMSYLKKSCPLESRVGHTQKCTSKSNPIFEEFRMWQFVNNLSFVKDGMTDCKSEKIPLTLEEKRLVCSAFMRKEQKMAFSKISNLFKAKFRSEHVKFYGYEDDDMIPTCSIRYCMKSVFGDITYDEQAVFNVLYSAENDAKIKAWMGKHYPQVGEKGVKELLKIKIEDDAAYSLKAIKKILPFLQKGHDFELAKFLAKLPDFIPNFAEVESAIVLRLLEIREFVRNQRQENPLGRDRQSMMELRKRFLMQEYGLTESQWGKLYLGDKGTYDGIDVSDERIPPVNLEMYRNPIVQRVCTIVRKVVNKLHDAGIISPRDTAINVECAREVNTLARKGGIALWQKARAKIRDKAKVEIEEVTGQPATERQIERWLFWKEQDEKCIYTGKTISMSDVLSIGGVTYDIEHTLPLSLSGDDTLANKTLCFSDYNREVKKNRIPSECGNYETQILPNLICFREKRDKAETYYRKAKNKARGSLDFTVKKKAEYARIEYEYWREKVRRFEVKREELVCSDGRALSGFTYRQLVDTSAIAMKVKEFLGTVYPGVHTVKGSFTALARKCWGLQTTAEKDRSDHTHHAVDAAIIATYTPSRAAMLLDDLKSSAEGLYGSKSLPCKDFAEQILAMKESILVKHLPRSSPLKQSQKKDRLAFPHQQKGAPEKTVKYVLSRGDTIRGALHNDTYYRCIMNPYTGEKEITKRIVLQGEIQELKQKVLKVIDRGARAIIISELDRIASSGATNVDVGMIRRPDGTAIRSISVKAEPNCQHPLEVRQHTIKSKHQYKNYYYSISAKNSNFRMALFERNGKRSIEVDSIFKCAKDHKRKDFVPYHKRDGFLGYVPQGAMAIWCRNQGIGTLKNEPMQAISKCLYVITAINKLPKISVDLRYHREARPKGEIPKVGYGNIPLKPTLYITGMTTQLLYEGIDFHLTSDGKIQFSV